MRFALLGGLRAGLLASAVTVVAALLVPPCSAEAATDALWQGVVATDSLNVRSEPHSGAAVVAVLPRGRRVSVVRWVSGEEVEPTNNTWAQLGEGQYVYSALIRKLPSDQPPAPPTNIGFQGKWIDVNVTQQVLTAYQGDAPIRSVTISSGRPDYPTPVGTFRILRRVMNETMDSTTLPWVRDRYRLENVLFTQYFTPYGAALHLAWWKSEDSFGIPTSHGCVGLKYQDAEWLWNWAAVGVPIVVHQ